MYPMIFLLLIFFDFIEVHVPMANYWDELAAFLVLCWGVSSFRRNPGLGRRERESWLCLILMIVLGALGNLFHPGLQTRAVAVVKDVVALSKFPLIVFVLQRRTVSRENQEQRIRTAAKMSRWILLGTLAGVLAGCFWDLGFFTGEVRLVPAFRFVYSHPTFFISACVMMAAALIAESLDKNAPFLLLDCLLIFMAQRSKGHIFLAFLLFFVLLGEERIIKILTGIFGRETEKVKPTRIILAVAVVGLMILVVGKPRLDKFISLGMTTARTVLHVVGIKILVDFFPLGSGFGTFASYLSGRYYSNLYGRYGIENVYGMTEMEYNFISDVYWPYIYGQFGFFGLLVYLRLIFSLFIRQFRSGIPDSSRIAMVAVWIYALIASTSEAYFTNGTGVQMALFLGLFLGYGSVKEEAAPEKI